MRYIGLNLVWNSALWMLMQTKQPAAAQAVATLDALISFARCAADYGYARPVVDDSGLIEIVSELSSCEG